MAEESKYSYDEESVKAIIEWAQTTQLPKEVMLSEAEHIFDTSMYVNANICDIKQHYPDAFYNPAIDRLYWWWKTMPTYATTLPTRLRTYMR